MFATTFSSVNSIHTLTVDSSKEAATTRYLDSFNCDFSRYFSSNGYTRYTLFNAAAAVLEAISKKYSAPAPVPEEPVVMEPAVTQPAPSSPAFIRIGGQYQLTVSVDAHDNAREYLSKNGCRYSCTDIGNTHYTFLIAYAPAKVVDAISKKYPLQQEPAPVVEEVEEVEEPAPVVEVTAPVPASLLECVVGFMDSQPFDQTDIMEAIAYLQSFLPTEEPALQEPASPDYDPTEQELEEAELAEAIARTLNTGEVKGLESVINHYHWLGERLEDVNPEEIESYEDLLHWVTRQLVEFAIQFGLESQTLEEIAAVLNPADDRKEFNPEGREVREEEEPALTDTDIEIMKAFDICVTQLEVKKTYFELAKKFHPDCNGGDARNFDALNREYRKQMTWVSAPASV